MLGNLQKSLIKASFSAGIKPIVTSQSSTGALSFRNYSTLRMQKAHHQMNSRILHLILGNN